jgi:hypothetical protein
VSVAAKNLFLIAPDFRGLDPEAMEDPSPNAGIGFRYSYYNMPLPRDFIFGLRLNF